MKLIDTLSPIRGTGFAAGERLDPFYDRLWSAGARGVWASAPETRRQVEAGLGDLTGMSLIDEEEAISIVNDPNNIADLLPALGVIENMRTVTIEQLSALTGKDYSAPLARRLLSAAFAADLIDIGRASDLIGNGISAIPGYLLRPAKGRRKTYDRKLRPKLTFPEQVSVTGGHPYSPGGQYDRHNIISVEMLLRASEMLDIGTVVGEKYCTADMLFGSGLGRSEIGSSVRADGMIIRPDGTRIAIEMTSSANSGDMWNKVKGWAEYFDAMPYKRNGVIVLFVVAPSMESRHTVSALTANVKKSIKRAVSTYPGSGRIRTRDRFALVDWPTWFPDTNEFDPSFLTLQAKTRTGSGEDKWLPVDLLEDDRYDVELDFDAEAVMTNIAACHQTPPWIRQRFLPPDLTEAVIGDVTHRVPVLPPVKKEMGDRGEWVSADEAKTVATGAVSDITTPTRMRTLGI